MAAIIETPPSDSRYFGKLRAQSGYCVAPGSLAMAHCRPHMYEPARLVTLDFRGRMRGFGADECLEMEGSETLQWAECREKEPRQYWTLSNGAIRNVADKAACLTHHTDAAGKHSLAVSPCVPEDRLQQWAFLRH